MIGVGLAAGSGTRARPLTLKTSTYLRSKAAIRFLGIPVIEWQLLALREGGIQEVVIVARGRENRFQIKTLVGYGERLGMSLRYSPPVLDHLDRGSADATIRSAEYFDLDQDLFIFPVDSLITVDFEALARFHHQRRAAFTIVVSRVPAKIAANTYGVVVSDPSGRVTQFWEKPSPEQLEAVLGPHWAEMPLETNAGFYVTSASLLKHLATCPGIVDQRTRSLDFGHDLLPWLIREGYPVVTHPASWVGDLGNLGEYLRTMREILSGQAKPPGVDLGPDLHPPHHVLGPARPAIGAEWESVRLGRFVHIGPDCRLKNVSVGDECLIGRGVELENVHLDDGAMVGDGAVIHDSVIGLMTHIHSSLHQPVRIRGLSGIGDEAVVEPGCDLSGVLVYPRTRVFSGLELRGPAVIKERSRRRRIIRLTRRPVSRRGTSGPAQGGSRGAVLHIHKISSAGL